MLTTKRILAYGLIAVLVVPALACTAYWYTIAGRISAALDRFEQSEIIPGVTLQFAETNIGGFPFRFDIVLGGVTLAARGETGTSAWRSERIALHRNAYGAASNLVEIDGLQTFSWPAENGAPQHILQLQSGVTRAVAAFENGRLANFALDIVNGRAMDAALDAAPMRELRFARARLQFSAQDEDMIGVVFELDAGEIGAGFRPALGENLSRVRIQGTLTEAHLLQELRGGNLSPYVALDFWRDAGGSLILNPIEAAWGGTLLLGKTELALDNDRRFSGLVTASPEDPVSFLGALAQSPMFPAEARAQLAAFRELAAGLPGNLDLPIRVEARLPFGAGEVTPRLRIAGMSGIVVIFASTE